MTSRFAFTFLIPFTCLLNPAEILAAPPTRGEQFFEAKVRPILLDRCDECHGADGENDAGLYLTSRAALLKGGRSGPAILPGNPQKSLLVHAINHDVLVQMPPKSKLPQSEIKILTAWVKMGAPWPAKYAQKTPLQKAKIGRRISIKDRSFWSFRPVQRPALPAVKNSTWVQSPVDRFVLAKLERSGLSVAPTADRVTLLRRMTLDLWGLPPTPRQVKRFLADKSPNAIASLVDRLLAAPQYGERWGRHWLDVVRYADSNGMDDNMTYVDAWRYRNYVIRSMNADKSYARFVQEQIAGDLMQADADQPRYDPLIATGFLMIGPKMLAEDDPVKQQMDIVDDQIDTIGRSILGLTLGCARCHDHKFDPIPTVDYYGLAGIFKSTRVMLTYRVDSKWNSRALGDAKLESRLEHLEGELDRLDKAVVLGNFIGREQERSKLAAELSKVKAEYARLPKAMAAQDGSISDLQVFVRGNHLTRGARVARHFPQVLGGKEKAAIGRRSSGRLELAKWLTRPSHPLTSRVIVNRIWQGHFGLGIVRSPDNFGRLGQRPDNQPLLDWLAAELVEYDWSLKHLHRLILLSSAYQMSTHLNAKGLKQDPENRLLWRMNRRRLDAETIRDSILAISGQLSFQSPSVVLPGKTLVILSAKGLRDRKLFEVAVRSVYLPVLRSGVYEVFQAFDFPDPAVVNGKRNNTIVSSQALFMMNSKMMTRATQRLAVQVMAASGSDRDRIRRLHLLVLGRPATNSDVNSWLGFLQRFDRASRSTIKDAKQRRDRSWQAVARVLLSTNEFMYIE